MLRPEIDWERCQACQPCEAKSICPTLAIMKIDPDDVPYIALERCSGCGDCVLACCCGAIKLRNLVS